MRHDQVADYNWDDGLACIWPVVDDPATDFGTALLIYWRLEGPWMEQAENPANCNHEAWRLNQIVKQRLLGGFYPARRILYDPVQENHLSAAQVHRLKRAGVPDELIEPSRPV